MKTLKQILTKHGYEKVEINEYNDKIYNHKIITKAVKEWLQEHKQQAILNKNNGLHYITIEELTEEIEQ